jgi:small subunit ribosomal protein S21
MTEVKLRKGESVEKALKILRKKMDREETLKYVKERNYYEKPSVKRRRKKKEAKFKAMLQAREEKEWR